jgi:hypothetical protein
MYMYVYVYAYVYIYIMCVCVCVCMCVCVYPTDLSEAAGGDEAHTKVALGQGHVDRFLRVVSRSQGP